MGEVAWGSERFDSKSNLEFSVGSGQASQGSQEVWGILTKTGQIRSRCAWHARMYSVSAMRVSL